MIFARTGLLLALVAMLQAQPVSQQAAASASIEGIVVKSGTNEPIADADLELSRIEGTTLAPMNPVAVEMFSIILFGKDPPPIGGAGAPPQIASEIKYTKTGTDGKFSFANLQEGKYRLAVVRVGGTYYPAEYGQHDIRQRGLPFPVSAGQAVKNLKLEMATTSAITGQIVDEAGQPMGHVVVMALSEQYRQGEPRWFIEREVLTDERGAYRLFWLGPGKYYVGAVYEDPKQRSMNMGPMGPPGRGTARYRATPPVVVREVLPNGEVVEEAYGVVYYGGVVDPGIAKSIDARPGETYNGIDISMGAGKARTHHIRGIVISASSGQPAPSAQVIAIPQRWSPNALVLAGTTNSAGVFDLSGAFPERYVLAASAAEPPTTPLPPGAGTLLATLPGFGRPSEIGYLSVEVSNSDIENIKLVANGGINIPGRVVIEGSAASENDPDLSRMSINVVRDPDLIGMPDAMLPLPPAAPSGGGPPQRRPGNGQVLGNGDFNLFVSLGDFRLNVNGVPPNTYVKSVRVGGDDILRLGLHVAGAVPNPIQIVIGTDGGTVTGSVKTSISTPSPNSVVALVPETFDLRTRSDLYRSATTDSAGNFKVNAVAPGSYKLFAWEWAEPDAWQNPEFIRAFENSGIPITLSASSKQDNVQLNAIPLPKP